MRFFPFLISLLFLLSGCLNHKEESTLYINGRIEGDQYDVGTKYGGKIVAVYHDEGDDVKQGEILAQIDSSEVKAELSRAEASYRAALSAVEVKERELSFYREKLSSLKFKLSELENAVRIGVGAAEDRVRGARSRLLSAEATYRKAKATFEKAKKDYIRFKNLYRRRVISESRFDAVKLAYETARANLQSAKELVNSAVANLSAAEKQLQLAKNRKKEVSSLKKEISALKETVEAKEEEVSAYREKAQSAKALVEKVKSVLKNLKITSPINGTVTEKLIEPGEVVAPGQKLFTLYNLDKLYFEGYVPESKVGLIHIGQRGYIKVDAYPSRKFPVVLTFISSRAEFTPKEVQTKEERVKEVFKVKLKLLENPNRVLKPGMPADCYIPLGGR